MNYTDWKEVASSTISQLDLPEDFRYRFYHDEDRCAYQVKLWNAQDPRQGVMLTFLYSYMIREGAEGFVDDLKKMAEAFRATIWVTDQVVLT